jgi:hypothetical protein
MTAAELFVASGSGRFVGTVLDGRAAALLRGEGTGLEAVVIRVGAIA